MVSVSTSAQSCIATWELLAQCAPVVLLDSLLGPGHLPVHCVFKRDNAASESASWKGLSMAQGLCHNLRAFLSSCRICYGNCSFDTVRFLTPKCLLHADAIRVSIPCCAMASKPGRVLDTEAIAAYNRYHIVVCYTTWYLTCYRRVQHIITWYYALQRLTVWNSRVALVARSLPVWRWVPSTAFVQSNFG